MSADDADRLGELLGSDGVRRWRDVDDRVMGGVSQSRLRWTDTADPDHDPAHDPAHDRGAARFEGTLSRDRGGGFASVRRDLEPPLDLTAWTGLVVRARGDGRRYQLRLQTGATLPGGERIRFAAPFGTAAAWREHELPWTAFAPTFRGRRLDGPALDPARVDRVSLLVSDGPEGVFWLELARLRAMEPGRGGGSAGAR